MYYNMFQGMIAQCLYLDALVSLVADSQFLCDFIVISSDGRKLLFKLRLDTGQVNVDNGKLIDASYRLLVLNFNRLFGAECL